MTPERRLRYMADGWRIVSILCGVGSAVLIGLFGLLYAAFIIILSFPLVFRRAANVAFGWLLTAFAMSWAAVLAISPPLISNSPTDVWPMWVGIGVIPAAIAAMVAVRRVWRRGPN
jgi:hypothetical protein